MLPVALRLGPVQLFDAAAQLALFGALLLLFLRGPAWGGLIAWSWLALYPVLRFGIDYLRADPRVAFGLTQAQLVSLALAAFGVAGLGALIGRRKART